MAISTNTNTKTLIDIYIMKKTKETKHQEKTEEQRHKPFQKKLSEKDRKELDEYNEYRAKVKHYE